MCTETTFYITDSKNVTVLTDNDKHISWFSQWFISTDHNSYIEYTVPKDIIFRSNSLRVGTTFLKNYTATTPQVNLTNLPLEDRETIVTLMNNDDTVIISTTDYVWAKRFSKYFNYDCLSESFARFPNVPANAIIRMNSIQHGTEKLKRYARSKRFNKPSSENTP